MKNMEKYYSEIAASANGNELCKLLKKHSLPHFKRSCEYIECSDCAALFALWAIEEYVEPEQVEPDWKKVKVDTPIFVKDSGDQKWKKRNFAMYKYGLIYAFGAGQTSKTTDAEIMGWDCAMLAETEQ